MASPVSPVAHLRPGSIIGEKASGTRVLSDQELATLWRVAPELGYPYAPVYRLLILTGLRLNEVADAHWREFDLPGKLWVIPASRMKAKNHRARPHTVPLTESMLEILERAAAIHPCCIRVLDRLRRQAGLDEQQGQGAARRADGQSGAVDEP